MGHQQRDLLQYLTTIAKIEQDTTEAERKEQGGQLGVDLGIPLIGVFPLFEQARFAVLHDADGGPDFVHGVLARITGDHLQSTDVIPALLQGDALRQFVELGLHQGLQAVEIFLLRGVPNELPEGLDLIVAKSQRMVVRFKVTVLMDEKEAALARFRIYHAGKKGFQIEQHGAGMGDPFAGDAKIVPRLPLQPAEQQQEQSGDRHPENDQMAG